MRTQTCRVRKIQDSIIKIKKFKSKKGKNSARLLLIWAYKRLFHAAIISNMIRIRRIAQQRLIIQSIRVIMTLLAHLVICFKAIMTGQHKIWIKWLTRAIYLYPIRKTNMKSKLWMTPFRSNSRAGISYTNVHYRPTPAYCKKQTHTIIFCKWLPIKMLFSKAAPWAGCMRHRLARRRGGGRISRSWRTG